MQVPNSKPRMISSEIRRVIEHFGVDMNKYPAVNIGFRGYYSNTLGEPNKNDIGIYDDGLSFYTQNISASFNANVDPSRLKPNVASVVEGVYYCHIIDVHRGSKSQYPAICQRKGNIKVFRYGTENVPIGTKDKRGLHLGNGVWEGSTFGINIHKGGYSTTSSEGCTTLYPTQWDGYFNMVQSEMKRLVGTSSYKNTIIPYILISEETRKNIFK